MNVSNLETRRPLNSFRGNLLCQSESFSVYMPVYAHACAGACASGSRGQKRMSSLITFLFEARSLPEAGAHWCGWIDCPASSYDQSSCLSPLPYVNLNLKFWDRGSRILISRCSRYSLVLLLMFGMDANRTCATTESASLKSSHL